MHQIGSPSTKIPKTEKALLGRNGAAMEGRTRIATANAVPNGNKIKKSFFSLGLDMGRPDVIINVSEGKTQHSHTGDKND